jgi:hypothetical protein
LEENIAPVFSVPGYLLGLLSNPGDGGSIFLEMLVNYQTMWHYVSEASIKNSLFSHGDSELFWKKNYLSNLTDI